MVEPLRHRQTKGGKQTAGSAFVGLSVIQSFKVLCDCSQIRIGCNDLEVAAANSSEPPFAHLRYRLASDKAAKLRTEATVPADD
jgi:hypothetical protein